MGFLRKSLTFDFGSANTVVCENGQIVFDETTLISVWPEGYIEVGQDARRLRDGEKVGFWGQWPAGECNKTFYPISNGYVGDFYAFDSYVKGVLKKLTWLPRLCSVRIAIPDDLSCDEGDMCTRVFYDPFYVKGIKDIKFIHQSVAASIGLNLSAKKYHLIVDIGYGKTQVSLVKDLRVVKTKLWRNVSGCSWISDIKDYLKFQHHLKCGQITAEWLLISVAAANEDINDIPNARSVTGPSVMTAHPVTVTLDHKELAKVLNPNLQLFEKELDVFIQEDIMTISEDVRKDIVSEGLWLIGGGSRLRGLSERLKNNLNLSIHTTDNPFHVIARGAECKI